MNSNKKTIVKRTAVKKAANPVEKAPVPKKKVVKRSVTKKVVDRSRPLSAKDKVFVDNFFGGPTELRGNAKACYQDTHPRAKGRTAEIEGPKLLRKPTCAAYLAAKVARIQAKTDINAQYVLEQAVELYETCMSRRSFTELVKAEVPQEVVNSDGSKSIVMTEKNMEVEKREFNSPGAGKALEMIGKHILVKAFQEQSTNGVTVDIAVVMGGAQKRFEALVHKRNNGDNND